jgi:hypothetical protein
MNKAYAYAAYPLENHDTIRYDSNATTPEVAAHRMKGPAIAKVVVASQSDKTALKLVEERSILVSCYLGAVSVCNISSRITHAISD